MMISRLTKVSGLYRDSSSKYFLNSDQLLPLLMQVMVISVVKILELTD